jgi:ABC-2 type transport system ATP-binding protein
MMENNNVIEVKELTKMFGDFTAVSAITFEVKQGEIFGFLGANGAGKTTAMKMLIGISKPTAGDARVAGFDVVSEAEDIKKNIGYMSQKFALYDDLTVKENITFFGGIYGLSRAKIKEKTRELTEELGLKDLTDQLVGSLPLGWKQKIAFSVSLLHEPKIVFLDEPTGGVDPITRRQFWEMIYKSANKGTTIFVTTHYMDEAEYCDRVSIMVNGKIEALDSPKKLKEQYGAETMNDVFLKLARG